MRIKIDAHTPLPLFRRDIVIYPGPIDDQGGPTYSLIDPLNDQYYKLNWAEGVIIQCLKPGMTLETLLKAIKKRAPLDINIVELRYFFEDAANKYLLEGPIESSYLHDASTKKEPSLWESVGSKYFYTRLTLFNPDKFLIKTLPYVRPLASPQALTFYALLSLIGLICIITRWTEYVDTFLYFFNFTGLVYYALALSLTKFTHELAHAYTCRAYGAKVPKVGVAFIILWPVLFTDVTDNWKLGDRWQRITIAAAGTVSESVIAGLATIGWALAPEGPIQSIFFVLSSVSWFSTLFVNLNPAQRFDGYYILSDFLGIENLQSRAFNLTCWKLKQWFLGMWIPSPEERLTPARERLLILYTFYTWAYRLFLYSLISYFIYSYFPKIISIPLIILQIWLFLMKPIYNELKSWYMESSLIRLNWRLATTFFLLTLLLVWFIFPWPHHTSFSAITTPEKAQVLYVPESGWIQAIKVQKGQKIEKGSEVAQIVSLPLLAKIRAADLDSALIEQELKVLSLDKSHRPYLAERSAALEGVKESLSQLQAQQEEMTVYAGMSGQLFDWDDDLKVGMPVAKDQTLGKIANLNQVKLLLFVPEDHLQLVWVGQKVNFHAAGGGLPVYSGTIQKIHPARDENLSELPLASIYQGDLPVTSHENELKLIDSYYLAEVTLDTSEAPLRFGVVGYSSVKGPWRSYFVSTLRYIGSLFWRESSV